MTADDVARRVELSRLLDELGPMLLLPVDWERIAIELEFVERGDDTAVARLSQITFEARIERRFHGGRADSTLPPTKQTSALPWVGLVCGGLLLAVGGSLGGGAVFVGVALLGVFVFGIAMAGSRVAHRNLGRPETSPADDPTPAPPEVDALIASIRRTAT